MILSTVLLSFAVTYSTIRDQVYFETAKYDIEPELVLAIIKVESNFNPKAKGKLQERGLMQLWPKYFNASFEPAANIEEGVKYLAKVQKICKNRYKEAWFVCFNHGPNRTLTFVKNSDYYIKVRRAYEQERKKNLYRVCPSRSTSKFCDREIP